MKTTVRAPRGFLAGFGTSGSLLAGAAVLFVLGSAIVAFRGWPQIANGPASVVVTAAHPAAPSRVARRLAAVLRGTLATGGAALAPAGTRRGARGRGSQTSSGAPSGSLSTFSAGPRGSSPTAVTAAGPSAACGSGCNGPRSPSLVSRLTTTVSQAVSSIGSSVGSGVSSGSNTVGNAVGGASPQSGSAVQSVGNSAGSTVSGTSSTAANTVTQVGSALGGGH